MWRRRRSSPSETDPGKYLLKSDGFYCLNEDGTKETAPAVHYFDHMEIDGTVLNGFYYHDETGRFAAGNAHIAALKDLTYIKEDSEEKFVFDGLYMVNNLGRLSAAPQVRYISGLKVDKKDYEGYYYFNEYGRMVTDPGFHELDMSSNGQRFCGTYYFGGPDGVLVQEAGITPEGLPVDETGRIFETEELGIKNLQPQLESIDLRLRRNLERLCEKPGYTRRNPSEQYAPLFSQPDQDFCNGLCLRKYG